MRMRRLGVSVVLVFAGAASCSSASTAPPIGAVSADGGVGGADGGRQSGSTAASTSGAATRASASTAQPEGGTSPRKHSGSGDAAGGSCLGAALLQDLGKDRLIVGGTMQAATAAMAPFDLQYVYISGGLADGAGPCASCASGCTAGGTSCANSGPGCAWWGCWQYDVPPPGDYVRTFASTWTGATPPQVPMLTYYQILQSSGVAQGAPEVTQAATDVSFMSRYYADWRFLLQQVGGTTAILHVEPDFWGFAQQLSNDATSLPAAVASANAKDCGSLPNTIGGMGRCMIGMAHTYAPHAKVGLHASAWSTNVDVELNTVASLDVAAEAQKTAAFLAACGETSADLVIVETSDRDAGYYQTVEMRSTWWAADNLTLPDFHQDFAWVKALTEALGQPALYWQTPYGNAAQNNTTNHYQDNRVDYFLAHMGELAAAHAIGAAFGAGAGDQTTAETDGGNFVSKAKAYLASSGQPACF